MKRLDYVLCDIGIISRCSAVLRWSCNANKEILTVCSSSKATWSFMSSDTTRTMPLCSPLKYLHRKHFVVVYPFGRATKISFPLIVSEKTSTCFSFKSSYFLPLPVNNSPLIHCGMPSTSFSISHLVIKWMLRAAMYHVTEYCPQIGPQYPVWLDSSCIHSWPGPSLSMWKCAGLWD